MALTKLSRLLVAVALLVPAIAQAGGMTLVGRGARPLGRAGSYVAGADDGEALYYNPAGLADVDGVSLLVDAGFVLQRTHYARVDSGGNPQPAVDGDINPLAFPTAVLTYKPRKLPWLTVAGGVWVPYLGLNSYPETGPQRYSLITLNGSLILVAELAAAFRIHEHFWLGAGFEGMFINFKSRLDLSACTELNCAPEDPHFDALTELNVTAPFVPSGVIGATVAYPKVRVGVTLQLPFFVHGDGTVKTRLPTDPFFTNATVNGSSVSLDFVLPLTLRAGVEWRPIPRVRVEAGVDYEAWSMQQDFTIQPHGIYLDGVPGIGRYYLNTLKVNRKLNDTVAAHIGGEWEVWKKRLVLRLGYLLETSATPDETLSVLTSDGFHNMISVGAGLKLWGVRFDLGYAHLFTSSRDVDYRTSQAYQQNPVQPNLGVGVGGGHYDIDTDILSVGLDARF